MRRNEEFLPREGASNFLINKELLHREGTRIAKTLLHERSFLPNLEQLLMVFLTYRIGYPTIIICQSLAMTTIEQELSCYTYSNKYNYHIEPARFPQYEKICFQTFVLLTSATTKL